MRAGQEGKRLTPIGEGGAWSPTEEHGCNVEGVGDVGDGAKATPNRG